MLIMLRGWLVLMRFGMIMSMESCGIELFGCEVEFVEIFGVELFEVDCLRVFYCEDGLFVVWGLKFDY